MSVESELQHAIDDALDRLRTVTDARAGEVKRAGQWTPKEIIGHLIDSASNNHGRFVRAQSSDDLICQRYDQDAWVAAQGYGNAPWTDLLDLWHAYNSHLSRIIALMPPETRTRPRVRHNLHEVAWVKVMPEQPATLEYFIGDYLGHLKHHLRQVFERLEEQAPGSIGA